jgi:hypothetical protein
MWVHIGRRCCNGDGIFLVERSGATEFGCIFPHRHPSALHVHLDGQRAFWSFGGRDFFRLPCWAVLAALSPRGGGNIAHNDCVLRGVQGGKQRVTRLFRDFGWLVAARSRRRSRNGGSRHRWRSTKTSRGGCSGGWSSGACGAIDRVNRSQALPLRCRWLGPFVGEQRGAHAWGWQPAVNGCITRKDGRHWDGVAWRIAGHGGSSERRGRSSGLQMLGGGFGRRRGATVSRAGLGP